MEVASLKQLFAATKTEKENLPGRLRNTKDYMKARSTMRLSCSEATTSRRKMLDPDTGSFLEEPLDQDQYVGLMELPRPQGRDEIRVRGPMEKKASWANLRRD